MENENSTELLQYGLILSGARILIETLNHLSMVEWLKRGLVWVKKRTSPGHSPSDLQVLQNLVIDGFIIAKWGLVAALWHWGIGSQWARWAVGYLLFFNLFSYFYHHIWDEGASRHGQSFRRIKRRFLSAIMAVSYSVFGFAYLYRIAYPTHFTWQSGIASGVEALLFSVSHSLTVTFGAVNPLTSYGRFLCACQLVNMFAFVSLILVTSIPNALSAGQQE